MSLMGIFDFFKRSDNATDKIGKKPGEVSSKEVQKWASKAGDKRAQNYDRQEALNALADLCKPLEDEEELAKTPEGRAQIEKRNGVRAEAVTALLKRFTFVMEPSITDSEEKAVAFEGIKDAGELALAPVRHFVAKAESINWPTRIVKALVDEEAYVGEVLEWLSKWDTEYAKFIDPKIQLLVELEEHKDPRILDAVSGFLLDVNEVARFHAVGAALHQESDAALGPLVSMFIDEESVRIRTRVADAFSARGWSVPEDQRADARKSLPSGYTIDGEGLFRKKG
jgi:hypothetical protein